VKPVVKVSKVSTESRVIQESRDLLEIREYRVRQERQGQMEYRVL
jgi:hypothetical protein